MGVPDMGDHKSTHPSANFLEAVRVPTRHPASLPTPSHFSWFCPIQLFNTSLTDSLRKWGRVFIILLSGESRAPLHELLWEGLLCSRADHNPRAYYDFDLFFSSVWLL